MYTTLDDFRQRYESLSDEALLAENRDELVEVAQQSLDAELARRGLAPAPSADAPEPPPTETLDPGDELVDAATFLNQNEAEIARALLESSGIPCAHADEKSTGTSWSVGGSAGSLRLLVPARFLDQAREILAAPVSEEELAAEAEAAVDHSGEDAGT